MLALVFIEIVLVFFLVPLGTAPNPYPSIGFFRVEKLTLFFPIVFIEVKSVFILFYFVLIISPDGDRTNSRYLLPNQRFGQIVA